MGIRTISTGRAMLLLVSSCVVAAYPALAEDQPDPGAEDHRVSMSEIRDRAGSMPIDQRKDIDKRITATVERVNRDVATTGQAKIATKLASGFGITIDALLDVKSDRGFSWGELVVARTLLSDSKRTISIDDLGSLRAEGFTWGALAYALGFHLEDLEDAIRAQGRIATGLSKGGPAGK
jgi:hypothetical protein